MVIHNVDVVHKHAPLKFIELLQLLRVAKSDVLDSLWTQYKNRPHFRYVGLSRAMENMCHGSYNTIIIFSSQALDPEYFPFHWYYYCSEVPTGEVPCW